jgi:hypothetical protein
MSTGSGGPDRRLLAAFYTQYVALLLILITYTVGLLAGAPLTDPISPVDPSVEGSSHTALPPEPTLLGTFTLRNIFLDDGRVAFENPELAAIAAVLRSHDVSAVVSLSVPRLDVQSDSSSFRRALRRVESLESFFAEYRVPEDAFRVVVRQANQNARDIEIELQAVAVGHEGNSHVSS